MFHAAQSVTPPSDATDDARLAQPDAGRHQPAHVYAERVRAGHRLRRAHGQGPPQPPPQLQAVQHQVHRRARRRWSGMGAPPEMLCITKEAGRLWLAGCSEQECGWVPRRELESWLCLMHEVAVLRVPLMFGRAHADITLSEGGAVATKSGHGHRSAAGTVVMRSGSYFAQITVLEGLYVVFGVIRPGWDVEGGEYAHHVFGHCFYMYFTGNGNRHPGNLDWQGSQHATEHGDRIGMLLDLDQGSVSVWKNDEKLGVMLAEGLSGPLCWAVANRQVDASALIASAPAPPSPTEEELTAAKA